MKRKIIGFLLSFAVPFLFVFYACAEIVVLKTGQRVEGKVLEKKDGLYKVEVCGIPLTYGADEVEKVEAGAPEAIPAEAQPEKGCEIIRGMMEPDPVEANDPIAPGKGGWTTEHHGVIFYQDYPSDRYSLPELAGMAKELGADMVKTWLKGNNPGDIPAKAGGSDYRVLFDSFKVTCLNVCPEYILSRWDEGRGFDAQTSQDVESDFYQLTKFLIDNYNGKAKTFIINYFFEVNVYMGTEPSGRAGFPVVDFVNSAQRGVKRAMAASSGGDVKIYDCLESNCSHDNFHFVKNVFPLVSVDLYSLSYYGTAPMKSLFDYWSKNAPDSGIFGAKNVMIGEYGIKLEDGRVNGSQEVQARYLESVRKEAEAFGAPFIFLFWLADQESKVSAEGHFGLVDLQGNKSKAWDELAVAYRGQ